MTSSLVGSEMCIRDRFQYGGDCPYPDGALVGASGIQHILHRLGRYFKDCLLYTSDAADDM
eukprot:2036229-Prorocentrum_lima.AAC.1